MHSVREGSSPFRGTLTMTNSKTNKSILNRIPIIDIAPLVMPDRNTKLIRETGDEIREACRSVGFFYIKNHQIPQSHIDSLISLVHGFFNLSLEEKMKIHINKSDIYRGYYTTVPATHSDNATVLVARSDQYITAELKPPSSINNIKSFQLKLENFLPVPAKFEINDITIVYRMKNVR